MMTPTNNDHAATNSLLRVDPDDPRRLRIEAARSKALSMFSDQLAALPMKKAVRETLADGASDATRIMVECVLDALKNAQVST